MKKFEQKNLLYLLVFLLGFLIPLTYALYSNNTWEDWYITYRASKNLAIGNGLVFTVGERVHSFTSPLGTLIPSFFNLIIGNSSDDLVLWLFRIFNCLLLGLTGVILLKIADHLELQNRAKIVLIGMVLLDAKSVSFSINGMETGMMILFLSLLLYSLIVPLKHSPIIMGLIWGALMWTRPDSFIYIAIISSVFFLFNPELPIKQTRKERFGQYCIAGIVATVIYAPWLIWAWSYYGSFVPNTIVAKGLSHASITLENKLLVLKQILTFPFISLKVTTTFDKNYLPAYAVDFGGWPTFLFYINRFLSWVIAFIWLLPFVKPLTRTLSLATLLGHLYLVFVVRIIHPWYVPSVTLLSTFALALLIDQMLKSEGNSFKKIPNNIANNLATIGRYAAQIVSIGLLIMARFLLLANAYESCIRQEIIEDGNCKQIGLWLKENAGPKDRVFLECLGYIGFYSNLKMYDYPGLSSPEMIAARRKLNTNDFATLIDYLKPEWLVLRPGEASGIFDKNPLIFREQYKMIKIFDTYDQLAPYKSIPGYPYLEYDQTFVVYRHN